MAQPVSYIVFDIQLMSDFTEKSLDTAGGVFNVMNNGTAVLTTIYDPDNNYALVTQPKALINGKLRFAVQFAGGGQPNPPTVDVAGITAAGKAFYRRGCTPGDVPTLWLDMGDRDCTAIIPWSFAQAGANVEFDTGWNLPAGTFVDSDPVVQVAAVDTAGGHTIQFGVLATPAGFATGISTATAGFFKGSLTFGSVTMGSLLQTVAGTGSTLPIPEGAVLAAAIDVSYKLSAGTVSGSGFLIFDYRLPPT